MSGSGGPPRVRRKDTGDGRHGAQRKLGQVIDRIFSTGKPQGVWASDDAALRAAARRLVPPATDRVPVEPDDARVFVPVAGSGLPGQRRISQPGPGVRQQPIAAGQPVGGLWIRPAASAYWAQGPRGDVHTYPRPLEPDAGGQVPSGQANLAAGRFLRDLRRTPLMLPPGPVPDDDDEALAEGWRVVAAGDPFLAHELALEARARLAKLPPPGGPGVWVRNISLSRGSRVAARAYQRKITRASPTMDYLVRRKAGRSESMAAFDGFTSGRAGSRGELRDAKHWAHGGDVVRALTLVLEQKNLPPRARDIALRVRDEARRQAFVARGVPIVWYVSDPLGVPVVRRFIAQVLNCSCADKSCRCPIRVAHRPP